MILRTWSQLHPIRLGLLFIIAFSVLRAISFMLWVQYSNGLTFEPTTPFLLFTLGLFITLSIGFIFGGLHYLAGVTWQRLGWHSRGWQKAIWQGLLGFIVLYLFSMIWGMIIVNFFPPISSIPGGTPIYRFSWASFITKFVWGFAIASWQEENLFRGYLQPALMSQFGYWTGLVMQAGIFAIAHLGFYQLWWQFVGAFVTGIILGWLRGRDRHLIAPFLVHGLQYPLIG